MPSIQVLKTRIRSVKNTKQITKAMQMVAASKMRRAQEATKLSAPYVLEARQLLTRLSAHRSVAKNILFEKRDVKSRLIIIIASDKGLAGAYNSNVLKIYTQQLIEDRKNGVSNSTIAIGRKAAEFVSKVKDTNVIGVYDNLPDQPTGGELNAVLSTAREQFVSETVDAVDVIYTEFISAITQSAQILRVLPAGFVAVDENTNGGDATYEPSTDEVLTGVAYRLIGAQIFQALLDARASEHSMRMIAMKNATDNASDIVDDLTLAMNKERQGRITQELAEISGGVEALTE
jgi:F-type H+-transporting ATPase subunit gamma